MIDLSCNCDGCRNHLCDGDAVYCIECFRELKKRIEELETELSKLKEAANE
jgi:hypothetical protein